MTVVVCENIMPSTCTIHIAREHHGPINHCVGNHPPHLFTLGGKEGQPKVKPLPVLHQYGTRIPGLVREHRADKANDDIGNSARTKGCGLKTRRIPPTLSALLLVELSIHGFYWVFATLAHAQNKSGCSRTNPGIRVLYSH